MINLTNKEELKHPKDQRFYQTLALLLGISALNSQCWDWFDLPSHRMFRTQRLIIYICVPIATASQIFYLFLNCRNYDIISLTMILIITLVTVAIAMRTFTAQTNGYKKVMREFMSSVHLYNVYALDRGQYTGKILFTVEKLTRWTFVVFYILYVACCLGFQMVSISHNISKLDEIFNKTTRLEILIHFWIPFVEYEYNVKFWPALQLAMLYCAMVAVPIIGLFDSINLSFLYHIIGHIKILKHRLTTNFNKCNLTQEEIKKNLIEISRYYVFITECVKFAEIAFGLNVVTVYFHNLISGGLFLFQITLPGNDLASLLSYSLLIPLFVGTMLLLSLALEHIAISADSISDLVYDLEWESMSIPNQKIVLMLLVQVQKPLEFKAAFDIKTGMQPAINIIKTAFSYYIIVKAI